MQTSEIKIPRKITNRLLHLAQRSPDTEICGLISSLNGIPNTCYPIDNRAEQPQQRFLLDAKQQIDAIARMRGNGEELFAIYHSHPNAPAVPSPTDLAMAGYREALNLIISLNTQGVLELRGFRIVDQIAHEVPLVLA